MATAPHWAGWTRWRSGPAASPYGGAGEPTPIGTYPFVEININNTWTDISSYVRYEQGISVTRGRSDEQTGQTEAGSCTFTVDNGDGRFTPSNPNGAWYGLINRGVRLRVYRAIGDNRYYRFWGELSSLPVTWDVSGNDVTGSVTASGIFRRLNQGSQSINSAMYRAAVRGQVSSTVDLESLVEIPDTNLDLIAYWPMEDAAGSTSLNSPMDNVDPMVIHGSPTLATYSDWAASDPLPTMGTGGHFSGSIPPYNPRSGSNLSISSAQFFLHMGAAVAAETSLLKLNSTGTVTTWDVRLTTAGQLRVRAYSDDAVSLLDYTTVAFNFDDGGMYWVVIDFSVGALTAGKIDVTMKATKLFNFISVYDDARADPTLFDDTGEASSGQSLSALTSVTVGADGGLGDGTTVGHLLITHSPPVAGGAAGPTFEIPSKAVIAYYEENPSQRVQRLCDEEGVPVTVAGLYVNDVIGGLSGDAVTGILVAGPHTGMGSQRNATLTALLQDCADTDNGQLFEARDAEGIRYRALTDLTNQAPALTLSYAAHELSNSLNPTYDDQGIINDLTISRTDGSSRRATVDVGPMSTQDPPAGIGVYNSSDEINLAFDRALQDQVTWRLSVSSTADARFPQIQLQLSSYEITADPQLLADALNVDVGDRIVITNPPTWLAPDDITLMVQGYSETLDQFLHTITFNCSPESPYHVGTWDTDRYDTGESRLSGDVAAGATSISVKTIKGPLWTTAAGDLPFDLYVRGERMTVTAISGSSSPQTFTVTRDVNGINLAHPNDTPVRLWTQARRSL